MNRFGHVENDPEENENSEFFISYSIYENKIVANYHSRDDTFFTVNINLDHEIEFIYDHENEILNKYRVSKLHTLYLTN